MNQDQLQGKGAAAFHHRWRMLLVCLFLVSFLLRAYEIDQDSFWLDEGLTPLRSGYSIPEILSGRITIQEGVTQDTHPPLHYLLMHGWRMLLDNSDYAFRVFSAFAGALALPVIAQLGRKMLNYRVGLWAALLFSFNPLQIWYAQEARMYTLLVLFMALASYQLWLALTEPFRRRRLALYLVFSALAIYTHYTAILLVGMQAFFWLGLVKGLFYRSSVRWMIAVGTGLLIPILVIILPRLTTGAEATYYYVPPWILFQDLVHGYGLGMMTDITLLGNKIWDFFAVVVILVGLVSLLRRRNEQSGAAFYFLLVYYTAVAIGLSIGSVIKPMYAGVRHIVIGAPAFFILLSQGIECLSKQKEWRRIIMLTMLASVPVYSLYNIYKDPSINRDDFRQLFAQIERLAGDNDVVVLNNAMHLPNWWHYTHRSDLEVEALPVYPRNYSEKTASTLASLSTEYDRIWFFESRPFDNRDDDSQVAHWLESHHIPVKTVSSHGENLSLSTIAYSTGDRYVSELPIDAIPLEIAWHDVPEIKAATIPSSVEGASTYWIDLFWSGTEPTDEIQLRFLLTADDSTILVNANFPWRNPLDPDEEIKDTQIQEPSDLVRSSFALEIPLGAPQGKYSLELMSWNNQTGLTSGEPVKLTDVIVKPTYRSDSVNRVLSDSNLRYFRSEMQLLKVNVPDLEPFPGQEVPIELYLSNLGPEDYQLDLSLKAMSGDFVATTSATISSDPSRDSGAIYRLLIPLRVDDSVHAGHYNVKAKILYDGEVDSSRPVWRPFYTSDATIGSISVIDWPYHDTLPQVQVKTNAGLGNIIELYGWNLDTLAIKPGSCGQLDLVWQATEDIDQDLRAFIHLSQTDETIITQDDRVPGNWTRPTGTWRKGEVLTDQFHVCVPIDWSGDELILYTGFYDPVSGTRLPIKDDDSASEDGRLKLFEWEYE